MGRNSWFGVLAVVLVAGLGGGFLGWRLSEDDPATSARERRRGTASRPAGQGPTPPGGAASTPTIQPGKANTAEGNAGRARLVVPITLTAASAEVVEVKWRTLIATGPDIVGQATEADDYAPASGEIRFEPGQTTSTVVVEVRGDTAAEQDEFVLVSLIEPRNARLGGIWGLGGGTIDNDD